jgi:hypothetical protein
MLLKTYIPSKYRFFNNLVSFFASVSALGTAFNAQAQGVSGGYGHLDFIALQGNSNVSGIELHFYPFDLLGTLVSNRWPKQLELCEHQIPKVPPHHPINLTGLHGVHGSMISSAFVQYFEQNRHLVESKFTSSTENWPMVWNFGRVIRNALVHKGTINIKSHSAPPIVWRTLSYSQADNGKLVLYQELTCVELILLMEDLDALI